MRKLLNTLYVTNENIYMTLDGENVVCKENMKLNYDFRFQILRQYFVSAILAVRLHSWGSVPITAYLLTSYLRQADFWLACRVRHTEMCC